MYVLGGEGGRGWKGGFVAVVVVFVVGVVNYIWRRQLQQVGLCLYNVTGSDAVSPGCDITFQYGSNVKLQSLGLLLQAGTIVI